MGTTLTGHLIGHSFKEMKWHRSPGWLPGQGSDGALCRVGTSSICQACGCRWLLLFLRTGFRDRGGGKGSQLRAALVGEASGIKLNYATLQMKPVRPRESELSPVGQICGRSGNYLQKGKNRVIIQETCCKVLFCCIQGTLSSRFRKVCVPWNQALILRNKTY